MSKKGPAPPPRPPAPKLGIGGFSFKALEEEDDEELTKVTGQFDKQVQRERQAKETSAMERSESRSSDRGSTGGSDADKSPLHAPQRQNSRDRLKEYKDRIQDTITKKLEEFSSDSPKEKTNKDDVFKDSFTGDHSNSADTKSLQDPGIDWKRKTDEADSEPVYFEAGNGTMEENDDTAADLEMVEEYYNPETGDFSDLPGVVPTLRQRKRFQKYRKVSPVKPPPPVSMSTLNKRVPDPDDLGTCVDTGKKSGEPSEVKLPTTKPAAAKAAVSVTYLPVRRLVCGALFLFLYMVVPLPSYVSGVVAGMVLASAGWVLYLWVTKPPKPREPIPADPPLDKLPPMPVPELREPKGEDGCYKGWMNESLDYNTDSYSINQTHSVYVHLEGTILRMRRPKVNIPKRAMWDEPAPAAQFVHQRHLDLRGSKVLLLPPELVKKRLWSKKYPICVALAMEARKASENADSETGRQRTGSALATMSASSSSDSVQGFEVVSEQKCDNSILYLFARTCREKEEWYKRLVAASSGTPLKNHVLEMRRILTTSKHKRSGSSESINRHKRQGSTDSTSSGSPSPTVEQQQFLSAEEDLKMFVMYMSRLMPKDRDSLPSSPAHTGSLKEGKSAEVKVIPRGIVCDPVLTPLNALLGRCFWDFLRDKYWSDKVKEKLQKKLSKIHIPFFIEELQISAIDLGTEVPVIRRTNKPFMDEAGFWVDIDVTYSGKFKMTIETKVNLLKLKKTPSLRQHTEKSLEKKKSAVTDSEEEDSAESSTDEEEESSVSAEEGAQGGGTGRKLMKYINKITASKYFQSAAENKYIKKAMTEVSNTPLTLNVEVQKLNGTLAVNIPPPPTDRLWYGFRGNPQLWLVAKPKVGEREVTMSHITDWIEKKLALEFQHVLVMPNMDDLIIPILLPQHAQDGASFMPHSPSSPDM